MSDFAEVLRLNTLIAKKNEEIARLRLLTDAPTVYKTSQNELLVEWPSDQSESCIITRNLLEDIIAELNATRRLREV